MYGLQTINSGGQTQIDGKYVNLMKYEQSLGNCSGNLESTFNISNYSGAVPVLAVRPDSNYIAPGILFKSGDTWTSFKLYHETNVTDTVNWIIFRDINRLSVPSYGLVVYDASGNLVFSSDEKYFKILNVFNGTLSEGGSAITHTVNDAENNFFLVHPFCSGTYISYTDGNYFYHIRVFRGIKKASSTGVTVGNFEWPSARSTISEADMGAWVDNYQLIEVANV